MNSLLDFQGPIQGFSDAWMTDRSTRCDGRRPRSAKARNRGKLGAGAQQSLWGFDHGGHRGDGGLGGQEWAGSAAGRAGGGGWMSGKELEALLAPCSGPGVRRNKASGMAADR